LPAQRQQGTEVAIIEVHVEESVFRDFPSFRRGLVLAAGLENQGHSPELENKLEDALSQAAMNPVDLKTDPRVLAWDEAHRKFGSNPRKFPPAHAALLKRVQKGGVHLPFINKVVAIMNFNSIADCIPVGGDDAERAGKRLSLRRARGDEVFSPLGSPDAQERPDPGEVIYVVEDSGEVMCRRWNWRNGHGTRITEESKVMIMNIDGLGEESEARALRTRDRVAQMLEKHCMARTTVALLSPSLPVRSFEI
jgi:DNA/RNA-binding domain of Phe-tRNA-synthetase-like protein